RGLPQGVREGRRRETLAPRPARIVAPDASRRRKADPAGRRDPHAAEHPPLRREAGNPAGLDEPRHLPRGGPSRPTRAVRAAFGAGSGVDATDSRRMSPPVSLERNGGCMKRILSLLLIAAAASASAQTSKEAKETMKPSEALERLKEGNARFVAGTLKPRDL